MSTTISIEEAKADLGHLLELAQSGHEVIIQDPQNGKTKLVPISGPQPKGPRILGLHEGEVWMSDDFNTPLPDAFWHSKDLT